MSEWIFIPVSLCLCLANCWVPLPGPLWESRGSTDVDLSEGSRRQERELLGMLRAVGGRWEQEILVTADFSLVQNWVSGSLWVFCSGGSGQLHSVGAKRKQHWDAVFVQGSCFNLGLFSLLGQPVSTLRSCSEQLWWPWCPRQGVRRGSALEMG